MRTVSAVCTLHGVRGGAGGGHQPCPARAGSESDRGRRRRPDPGHGPGGTDGHGVAAQVGWRWTFTVVAAVGAAGLLLSGAVVPRQRAARPEPIRAQVRVLLRPAVAVTFVLTILGYAGVFAAFTYLAPLAARYAGAGPLAVTVVVTAFGVGGVIGNALATRWTDAQPRRTLLVALAVLAACLLILPATMRSLPALVGVVAVFGAAAFATVPGLQARVIGLAAGAPTLAAATNVAAFNLANTIGAAIGGLVAATVGLAWTAPIGGLITLGGLALAVVVLHPIHQLRTTPTAGAYPTPSTTP